MNKSNILLIVTLLLLPWRSSNSMPKDCVHVEYENTFESIKDGKSVHLVIRLMYISLNKI